MNFFGKDSSEIISNWALNGPLDEKIYSAQGGEVFSVLIPTWNNLPYLKLCIGSILKNSAFKHQIIVHVNEDQDDTWAWLKTQPVTATRSRENIGICWSVNLLRHYVKTSYCVYMNDDMYVCPDWDKALLEERKKIPGDFFFLSSTMIEPVNSNNPCVAVQDFGRGTIDFKEAELLKNFNSLTIANWSGAHWPPNMVTTKLWDMVGGFGIEYSPGYYSDDDFALKLYKAGVRDFVGVGQSLVYHFMSKSTGRVKKNDGRKTFTAKWGIKPSYLAQKVLRRGEKL